MTSYLTYLLYCAASAAALYGFLALVRQRRFYRNLPTPPHSLLWGNALAMKAVVDKMPLNTYPQIFFTALKRAHSLPDIWYLDVWPFQQPAIILSAPEAAALVTTVTAFPQADIVAKYFAGGLMETFMEATNGQLWKNTHQMVVPGLVPSAIKTYGDEVVEQAVRRCAKLDLIAKRGELVSLTQEMSKFPFAVMGRVALGKAYDADEAEEEMFSDVLRFTETLPWIKVWSWNPLEIRRYQKTLDVHQNRLRKYLEKKLEAKLQEMKGKKTLPTKTTASSVVERMLLEAAKTGTTPSKAQIRIFCDNLFGLIVAGSNTTADTLTYALMLLQTHPAALAALREEHSSVFGPTQSETMAKLRANPESVLKLSYTKAVILETLRMFPIGMLVRGFPSGVDTLTYKGRTYPAKGHSIFIQPHSMHFDEGIFADADKFMPERHLGGESPEYPRDGFRPFERGLRSCPGQILAMQEMQTILLVMARSFDVEVPDMQAPQKLTLPWYKIEEKLGKYAFQTIRVTAGPPGDVKTKFHRRDF